REQTVGGEASVDRAEPRGFLRLAAGATDSGCGVDDQAVRLDQPCSDERPESENGRSSVAARRCNCIGGDDRLSIELGYPIDEAVEQLRRLVCVPVPAL